MHTSIQLAKRECFCKNSKYPNYKLMKIYIKMKQNYINNICVVFVQAVYFFNSFKGKKSRNLVSKVKNKYILRRENA